MLPTPSKCPTCGGPVVVASSGEGTSHYVPANAQEHTEALMKLDRLRTLLTEERNRAEAEYEPSGYVAQLDELLEIVGDDRS